MCVKRVWTVNTFIPCRFTIVGYLNAPVSLYSNKTINKQSCFVLCSVLLFYWEIMISPSASRPASHTYSCCFNNHFSLLDLAPTADFNKIAFTTENLKFSNSYLNRTLVFCMLFVLSIPFFEYQRIDLMGSFSSSPLTENRLFRNMITIIECNFSFKRIY